MTHPIATIIPPLLRADLIQAGLRRDGAAIDRVHKQARQAYPHLFRQDSDVARWSRKYDPPKGKL